MPGWSPRCSRARISRPKTDLLRNHGKPGSIDDDDNDSGDLGWSQTFEGPKVLGVSPGQASGEVTRDGYSARSGPAF